ncbi:WRKY transcription factor 19 [Phytophthora cinnamomi]|uniref:WRKY transcription factor 19 n=1 Tax=Phytophthora cinnamomi TaxID=4785 RepID=UPI0035596DF0|nr:WRKY transcription factor 19 [Phytophthora cinnamomi]
MVDVTTVGSDLTPAQQRETIADLAFFLDEFGSTRAVRAKLQEQERDIERLGKQVQGLLTVRRAKVEKVQREPENDTNDGEIAENIEVETEDADKTMVDLDFFLKTYKSTRAVREKLATQGQRIKNLHRTIQSLEKQRQRQNDRDDSRYVGYVGFDAAPKSVLSIEAKKTSEGEKRKAAKEVQNGVVKLPALDSKVPGDGDVTTVGSDLTPAQQSETLSDLAFFLDEFGSTRAVRGKLQEQEKDIMRLERQVHQFRATVGRSQDEKAQEDTKLVENHEIDISEEGVDETMVDLDFFLRIYKSTRSVREKLVIQRRRIEDLHRTIQELEQIHAKDDSCDANCLGTGQKGENHAETRRVDVGETGGDSGNEIDGGGGDAFDSKVDVAAGEDAIAASPEHSSEGRVQQQMRDPSAVGSDLTPAQQDEVMADLAFFLDEFGSTRAVRTKLQEQESDIKRLDGIVRRLLSDENDGADETMVDLDFFLRSFGSTRAVREKLLTQSQRIVGLQRTMKWLQERWNAVDESSSDVENLGTEPASKADKAESSKTNVESVNEDTDGTDNGSENEDADDEGDVVMVSTQQCENDSQEKEVEVVPAEPRNVVMISEECGASSSCSVADESDSSELTQAQQAFAEGSSATFEQKYRVDHGATAALKTVCPYLDCANYTQANHLCAVHGGFRTREVHGCIRKAVAQCRCRVHGGDRSFDQYITMLDVKAVGADLTPEQRDETMDDLSFFLDEFSSTRAVRVKLQKQEKCIQGLQKQVRGLLNLSDGRTVGEIVGEE